MRWVNHYRIEFSFLANRVKDQRQLKNFPVKECPACDKAIAAAYDDARYAPQGVGSVSVDFERLRFMRMVQIKCLKLHLTGTNVGVRHSQ